MIKVRWFGILMISACAGLNGVPAGTGDAGTTAAGSGGATGGGSSGGISGGGTGGRAGGGTGGAPATGTGGATVAGTGGATVTGSGGTQGTITRIDLTGKKVLLIVGSPTSPSTGDMLLQGTLEGKGMIVTLADASVVNPNAAAMDLIIGSDTAGSTFPTLYGGVAVPMIIFGNGFLQALGIIATSSAKGTISTPVTLSVLDGTTALAGALPMGANFLAIGTTRNTSVYWGTPGGSLIKVAGIMGAPTELTAFAYEKGAMMALGTAADRRVVLAWKVDVIADLSIESFKIMNAAIQWTSARL